MRSAFAALVIAVVALVAACGGSAPSAKVVEIAAQPAPPPGEVACMAALLEGTLALDPRSGLGVAAPDGRTQPVSWPNGWHALDTTPVVLVDGQGTTIARLGDHLSMGGGLGANDVWIACPEGIVVG